MVAFVDRHGCCFDFPKNANVFLHPCNLHRCCSVDCGVYTSVIFDVVLAEFFASCRQ